MASRRSSRLNAASGNNLAKSPSSNGSPVTRKKRKASGPAEPENLDKEVLAEPSTPKRKKATKAAIQGTSTPSVAKPMGVPPGTGSMLPKTRVADPHATNAPLISPGTTRVVANKVAESVSPSKALQSKTTTGNILEKACAHLIKVEPRLKPLIDKHHCSIFSAEGLSQGIDPFEALSRSIISQQVSGAAAKSIGAKFVALFTPESPNLEKDDNKFFPTPSQVAAADIAILRTAGLSQRKAEYIQGLAGKFASGELSTEMLLSADYEEVLEKLIAVRGLGKWSVEMFACFGLKRMDVFSTGDLGVQRGLAAFVGKDVSKLKGKGGGKYKYMSEKDMLEISAKFAPYRSLFMWYMWRVEDVDVSTLEK